MSEYKTVKQIDRWKLDAKAFDDRGDTVYLHAARPCSGAGMGGRSSNWPERAHRYPEVRPRVARAMVDELIGSLGAMLVQGLVTKHWQSQTRGEGRLGQSSCCSAISDDLTAKIGVYIRA